MLNDLVHFLHAQIKIIVADGISLNVLLLEYFFMFLYNISVLTNLEV